MVWGAGDKFDGGAGTDMLKLSSGHLNLTNVNNTSILNVETINMTGGGSNTLTVNLQDVLDISSTTNTLKVLGEGGDTVNFVGAQGAGTSVAGGFKSYTVGLATLLIDSDITVL